MATKRIHQHSALFIFNKWGIESLQSHNTILLFSCSKIVYIENSYKDITFIIRVPSSIQLLWGRSGELLSSHSLMRITGLCTLFIIFSIATNWRTEEAWLNWSKKIFGDQLILVINVMQCDYNCKAKRTCLLSLQEPTTRGRHCYVVYCSPAMTNT